MSIRNLDALFAPGSIAVIGASNKPGTVGAVLASNLFSAGFKGPIMSVNPNEAAVHSTLNYRSVADLPVRPDLAVLATPPATVPALIAELGKAGCRAAVVVTAGFGEGQDSRGEDLRRATLDAARPHLLRVLGPNCLGFISPAAGINASFAHMMPPAGEIALVTQSGAIATTLIDWAAPHGLGFSHIVSLGDMADVDFGDLLDYLALDRATRAILLYVEAITHARKFMSAARIAARSKPVIVVKAGRGTAGARAALSHTGALAGADLVYDAAFRRAGLVRVDALREMFEATVTLASGVSVAGNRLAIITNGGGLGVLAADELERRRGELATLGPAVISALSGVLPATWSHGNPVDIIGDASGDRYANALEVLGHDNAADAILVMNCPTAVADSLESARRVADTVAAAASTPTLTCWVGEGRGAEARRLFASRRIPSYETPDEAVRAFMQLVEYRRNREELLETPPRDAPAATPDRQGARALIAQALNQGRTVLSAIEAKALLAAYGVPTVPSHLAATATQAAALAADIGHTVALKILSPDISHKSDVGGVRLELSPAMVLAAARDMEATVRSRAPQARIDGFIVEPMVRRGTAEELLLGIADDGTFGPVILFGQGGVAAETIGDRVIGLPPLNLPLARHMMSRTRVHRLLAGYRDRPPADLDAIGGVLVRLAEMATDLPELAELDINPLLAGPDGVIALDARAVVRIAHRPDARHLAISPYPAELEQEVELSNGVRVRIRPIRPQDEPALAAMVAQSSLEDVRLRFLHSLKEFPHEFAARLSQIDYDREMALVVAPLGADDEIIGVARLAADPDNELAEFAVMVRSDMQGRGIGYRLMSELIAYARKRGIRSIFSEVLSENTAMLQMARELGFKVRNEADITTVALAL